MTYTDAIGKGSDIIKRNFWLVLVPIISDAVLLVLNYLFSGAFADVSRIPLFQLKFTVPSSLPSLKNVIDAFPDLISYNTNSGFSNSIMPLSGTIPQPWNNIRIICGVLLFSIFSAFLQGGFLGCIAKTYKEDEKSSLKDFIYFGRYYWSRFLVLKIIGLAFMVLAVGFWPIVLLYFLVSVFILYLSYALVWDDIPMLEAISNSISRSSLKFGNTLGLMIYIAFLLGLLTLIVVPLSRLYIFLGSMLYNACACCIVAGIMVMYAGEKATPEAPPESNGGSLDIRV